MSPALESSSGSLAVTSEVGIVSDNDRRR